MMRAWLAPLLILGLTGTAVAQSDGLGRALDQQRQDMERQQSESRQLGEAQREELRQQQEQSLRQQLQLLPLERRPLVCQPFGRTFICQ